MTPTKQGKAESCDVCGSTDPDRCSFEVCCSCWRGVPCAKPQAPRIVAECAVCVECRCEAYGKADHFCTDLVPVRIDRTCKHPELPVP